MRRGRQDDGTIQLFREVPEERCLSAAPDYGSDSCRYLEFIERGVHV